MMAFTTTTIMKVRFAKDLAVISRMAKNIKIKLKNVNTLSLTICPRVLDWLSTWTLDSPAAVRRAASSLVSPMFGSVI